MPWTLTRSVDRAKAFATSDRRQMILLIGLWLVIAVVTAVVYGVWRHGSSVRLSAAPKDCVSQTPNCKRLAISCAW